MNLWGFSWPMRPEFEAAMAEAADEDEVLLPELVGQLISGPEPASNASPVLPTDSRCVGVTHPDDLALVQARRGRRRSTGASGPATLAWSG